jgi:ribosome-binding protein aMBF1 (putative translation factor)
MIGQMGETSRRRTHLGEKASAALPMVWEEMDRRGWSDAKLADELAEDSGKLAKLLYGDRKPGRRLAAKLLARLGTPFEAWERPCPVSARPHHSIAS